MSVLASMRLEARMVVMVGVGLFLFSLVAGVFTYRYTFHRELAQAESLQQQLVQTVQAQAEVAAFASNEDIAQGVLSGLVANPNILAARIESLSDKSFRHEFGSVKTANFGLGKTYELFSPVSIDQQIGVLTVVQNDEQVYSVATSAALFQTILMLVQVLIAGGIVSAVLRVMLINPITSLANAMRAIRPGSSARLSVKELHAKDEIGLLSQSANAILDAAEAAIDEVKAQRNELREADERLNFAIEGAGDGVWDRNMRTGEMLFSRLYLAMLGYAEDELPHMVATWAASVHPDDMARVQGDLEAYLNGHASAYVDEVRLRCRDGSYKWVLCRGTVVARDEEGRPLRMIGIHTDISARKAVEAELVEARESAERATQAKSDFLSNMSHEVRTPMNAIIGMTHLALQTELNSRQRNHIEKANAAARSLLVIINDILDFSKIEAGKMEFESAEFHLLDVLERIVDLSIGRVQDKGLELLFDVHRDVPLELIGDAHRLGQILLNFVGNAIKFTERGEITVGIRVIATEPSAADGALPGEEMPDTVTLHFDVADSGIGLTPEQRSKLFNAFAQADASTTRKYGGTGLGLTISKSLVEQMNGRVGVESELGSGSTFWFTARFKTQAVQQARAPVAAAAAGLRILIVDDNQRARDILLSILLAQTFDATAVRDGQEALNEMVRAELDGRPYGLVLMDWMMPTMEGIEVIRRIRSDERIAATRVFLMVTANSRDEVLERAGTIRVDGVLLKPVTQSSVFDSILMALGKDAVAGRRQVRQADSDEAVQKLRGAHLLLVEDNPVNQELALELLRGAGISVDIANNGAEAVAMVARAAYDGVLMDCQMPVMDGFEAARRIRADQRFASLPILALTANAMSGDAKKCLAAGMNDHIGKPIDVETLFLTLARWVTPAKPLVAPSAADLIDAGAVTVAAGDQSADAMPAIAGLEVAQALRRMGGNAGLLRKLIRRFAETQADAIVKLGDAIGRKDFETAARDAHTLKGLASNIGATAVAASASELERLLKDGHGKDCPPVLGALKQSLSAVLVQIAAAEGLGQAEEIQPVVQVVDTAELTIQLQQLARLLAADDSGACKLADGVAAQLGGAGHAAAAKQLKSAIAQYEFDTALEQLREVAKVLGIPLQS